MVKNARAEGRLVVAVNRKARHHYEILEEYEAGLALKGPEVKSLRSGKAVLEGSFARVERGEVFLYNLHIAPYPQNTLEGLSPTRTRKLLMRGSEIGRLAGKLDAKGLSLVPTELYFLRGWAKIRLAVAKGKRGPDKREAIRKKETAREMERSFKRVYRS